MPVYLDACVPFTGMCPDVIQFARSKAVYSNRRSSGEEIVFIPGNRLGSLQPQNAAPMLHSYRTSSGSRSKWTSLPRHSSTPFPDIHILPKRTPCLIKDEKTGRPLVNRLFQIKYGPIGLYNIVYTTMVISSAYPKRPACFFPSRLRLFYQRSALE